MTGCINGSISLSVVQAGFDIDEFETTVSVEFDPSVFLGIEATHDIDDARTNMYGNLEIDVQVSGDDLDDEVLHQIREWVGRSPVYNLMTLGHEAAPQVSRKPGQSIRAA